MNKSYKKGFTLVELLAVIVILAIILVIAVPKITDVISDSRKSTLETSVKMIASAAEKMKLENKFSGNNEEITCDSVINLSEADYDLENCTIAFNSDNNASVTIKGKGKFEGLSVCYGTKSSATAQEEDCPVPKSFATDSWETIIAAVKSGNYPYKVGDTREIGLTGFTNGEEGSNGLYTIRIINTTPCSKVDVESKTACGFVLEFADILTEHVMNSTDTNEGGWPKSEIRKYLNDTIYNSLPGELKDSIIDTYVISDRGSNDNNSSRADGNLESTDKLYLLSGEETDNKYSTNGVSRVLDYYTSMSYCRLFEYSMWYRDALFDTSFRQESCMAEGLSYNKATVSNYVAPAFRLSS